METFEVDVVQFMRPNGRQVAVKTDLPIKYRDCYEEMSKAMCRLEAEHLTTGEVSVTIAHFQHGDIDIEVVPNGPEVQAAICEMLVERPWLHHQEEP